MSTQSEIPVFKTDPIVVLVLGLVTCGLYLVYWNMKAAEVLNAVSNREVVSPAIAAIGGIPCCMPVTVYFFYLCGEGLESLGRVLGRGNELKDKAVLLMVLAAIGFPMVSAMIVQGHINELYDRPAA